eukprot:52819-Eustigmatos_ZCMA.PRE.1
MSSDMWVEGQVCVDPSMLGGYDVWGAGSSVACSDINTTQMTQGGVGGPVTDGCACVHLCSCAIE